MRGTLWTEQDIDDLKYGVAHFTNEELAFLLEKPVGGVAAKIYRLGISRIKRGRFSREDEKLIETSIGVRPLKDVAREIGKTPHEVYCKVYKMALNAPIHRKVA